MSTKDLAYDAFASANEPTEDLIQGNVTPSLAAITEAIAVATPDTAHRLERQDKRPLERDLKREMRASLKARLVGVELEATEHKLHLDGWPRVGQTDVAILLPEDLPVLVELKWGARSLYNCA